MKLKLDYKDFLCDDLFVYWRTRRTVKLTQFWEDFINKNKHLRESFELAIATFDEIQKNKSECIIDEETVNRELQDRIYHLKKRKQLSIIVTSVAARSEEHTSELQSRPHLVCRLLLEKKKQSSRRPSRPVGAQE